MFARALCVAVAITLVQSQFYDLLVTGGQIEAYNPNSYECFDHLSNCIALTGGGANGQGLGMIGQLLGGGGGGGGGGIARLLGGGQGFAKLLGGGRAGGGMPDMGTMMSMGQQGVGMASQMSEMMEQQRKAQAAEEANKRRAEAARQARRAPTVSASDVANKMQKLMEDLKVECGGEARFYGYLQRVGGVETQRLMEALANPNSPSHPDAIGQIVEGCQPRNDPIAGARDAVAHSANPNQDALIRVVQELGPQCGGAQNMMAKISTLSQDQQQALIEKLNNPYTQNMAKQVMLERCQESRRRQPPTDSQTRSANTRTNTGRQYNVADVRSAIDEIRNICGGTKTTLIMQQFRADRGAQMAMAVAVSDPSTRHTFIQQLAAQEQCAPAPNTELDDLFSGF